MTKLETIETNWRNFLEDEGFHAKREWWQGELDCTEPEFIQYAKEFWNQLAPDEKCTVLRDAELQILDFVYHLSHKQSDFALCFYVNKSKILKN